MRTELEVCPEHGLSGRSLIERAAFFWLLALSVAIAARGEAVPARTVFMPEKDAGIESLEARAKAQKAALKAAKILPKFRFVDQREKSLIRFVHRIVDDAGRDYKQVHYDHGNAVAAADVDGDGRPDLYFTTQLGSNELWHNLGIDRSGQVRFEDWTARSGLGLPTAVSVGASFADADNDGDPDLYVTTVREGNVLFENLGDGRFRDVSVLAALDHHGHSSGAAFFDYNGTGRLDLLVTNIGRYTSDRRGAGGYFVGYEDAFQGHHFPERAERSLLFENRGDLFFTDVSASRGLEERGWSGDVTFMDFDRDGFPGIFVLNMQGDDRYYENISGQRFEDRTDRHFPKTPWGSMGVGAFDYDDDGLIDVLVTDMHSDMSKEIPPSEERRKSNIQWSDDYLQGGADNIFGNALYRNLGGGRFAEISDSAGVEHYWPWGLSVGDIDADGDQDIFMTLSMNYPFRYMPNALLLNDRGRRFLGAAFALGIEPRDEKHGPWFDLDCSGVDADAPFCQNQEGAFTVMGTLGSRSSVILDLDEDGDLDIVTNEFNSPPQILISELAGRREIDYLKVKLVGTRTNRDGLGAFVTVSLSDGRRYLRYHDGKSGYLAQSSLPLYYGFPRSSHIDRIEVQWPNGHLQTVRAPIETRRLVEIVEETPPPPASAIRPGR